MMAQKLQEDLAKEMMDELKSRQEIAMKLTAELESAKVCGPILIDGTSSLVVKAGMPFYPNIVVLLHNFDRRISAR